MESFKRIEFFACWVLLDFGTNFTRFQKDTMINLKAKCLNKALQIAIGPFMQFT